MYINQLPNLTRIIFSSFLVYSRMFGILSVLYGWKFIPITLIVHSFRKRSNVSVTLKMIFGISTSNKTLSTQFIECFCSFVISFCFSFHFLFFTHSNKCFLSDKTLHWINSLHLCVCVCVYLLHLLWVFRYGDDDKRYT